VLFCGKEILSSHIRLGILGGVIMLLACYLWALEGPAGYHIHLDADGNPVDSRGHY
jgi:cytochrome c oxidase subunit 1